MNVLVSAKNLEGDVLIPPSKSLSHRAIIAASLAEGESVISNVIYSKDILATIDGMRALGAKITIYDDYLVIKGSKVKRVNNVINANESGSTLRFLIPIALVNEKEITFVGNNHLTKRPLDTYLDIFKKQNISYKKENDYLPLTLKGNIKPGIFEVNGNVSSQFISGLLFSLPLLNEDSIIKITTNLESKGYIDLTLQVLKDFGIVIDVSDDYLEYKIKGNQSFKPRNYTIEGDYSQAAFFIVASVLGAKLRLLNMNQNSLQGDKKILDDIVKFGASYTFNGNELVVNSALTKGCEIDLSQSPDLGPILNVLAACSKGVTTFKNISRLRIKECDRVSAMVEELKKLNIDSNDDDKQMIVYGSEKLIFNDDLDSHNDHRIVMALSIASINCDSTIKIKNAMAVEKSFPNFFEVFESIGGKVVYEK